MVIITRNFLQPFFLALFFIILMAFSGVLFAEEDTQQDSSPQNIGGLLFDFDEGVKIEEGPGGSVYVKSNKEYMKKKFREIDRKLADLESRIKDLEENKLDELVKGESKSSTTSSKTAVGQTAEGRRVLST